MSVPNSVLNSSSQNAVPGIRGCHELWFPALTSILTFTVTWLLTTHNWTTVPRVHCSCCSGFWFCLFLAFTSLDLSCSCCFANHLNPCLFLTLLALSILDCLLNFNKPHLHLLLSLLPDKYLVHYSMIANVIPSFVLAVTIPYSVNALVLSSSITVIVIPSSIIAMVTPSSIITIVIHSSVTAITAVIFKHLVSK